VTLTIGYLDKHLDAIPLLARWHHEAWSFLAPHLSVADRIAGFRARARRGSIPTGFVALIDSAVVGMACLVECDVESHRHLTPWLATVRVGPAYRGQGIGSALCERATDEAAALGVPTLYLFTFDKEAFYARLGWSVQEPAQLAGVPGTIMARTLAARGEARLVRLADGFRSRDIPTGPQRRDGATSGADLTSAA
jgi:predicted N-acetyltransferase YhbS